MYCPSCMKLHSVEAVPDGFNTYIILYYYYEQVRRLSGSIPFVQTNHITDRTGIKAKSNKFDQSECGESSNRPILTKVTRTDRRKRTKLKQHTPRRPTLTNQDSRISGLSTDWPVTIQTWPKRTIEESGRIRTDQSAAAAAPTTLHIPVHVFASTNVKSRVTLNYFCMYFSLFLRVLKDEIKKQNKDSD